MHNYANDNTFTSFSNSIPDLVKTLENESNATNSWLDINNTMTANPEKFHALIITKNRTDNPGIDIKVGKKSIKSESYVKLLGLKLIIS